MKFVYRFALCLSILLTHLSIHADNNAIGLSAGLHGIGIDYQRAFNDYLNIRLSLTDMPLDKSITQDGVDYEAEYNRRNIGALVDFRPFAGTFHLTGGIYGNEHNINIKAKPKTNTSYKIGNNTYESSSLELDGTIEFAEQSPYMGLGWGGNIAKNGLAMNIDIGALYIGNADVNLKAKGQASINGGPSTDINALPGFNDDLNQEIQNIENDAKDYNWLPIIQIGLLFRF